MTNKKILGKNIREVRTSQGLSQVALANKCGFSNTILSQYETGKKEPGLYTIARIARELNVSIERLFYGDENISFISAHADSGKKIVNSFRLLWFEGLIKTWHGGEPFMPGSDSRERKVKYSVDFVKYGDQIMKLLSFLCDYQDTVKVYDEADSLLDKQCESVAAEINAIIRSENKTEEESK